MKIVQCTGHINHDGKLYGPGDNLGPISDADADRLVAYNVAKVVEDKIPTPGQETVAQLKEKAQALGIEGYGKMNKAQLIDAIAQAEAQVTEELAALREQADALEIEGYDKMTREQLIEAIAAADQE